MIIMPKEKMWKRELPPIGFDGGEMDMDIKEKNN
jgi:hypothetical protein